MTTDRARQFVLLLWLGSLGIQFANQVTTAAANRDQCTTDYFVPAHKLLAGALIFTVLGGLAEWVPALAVAFGAGIDLLALLGPAVVPQQGTGNTLFDRLASLVKASA